MSSSSSAMFPPSILSFLFDEKQASRAPSHPWRLRSPSRLRFSTKSQVITIRSTICATECSISRIDFVPLKMFLWRILATVTGDSEPSSSSSFWDGLCQMDIDRYLRFTSALTWQVNQPIFHLYAFPSGPVRRRVLAGTWQASVGHWFCVFRQLILASLACRAPA